MLKDKRGGTWSACDQKSLCAGSFGSIQSLVHLRTCTKLDRNLKKHRWKMILEGNSGRVHLFSITFITVLDLF